MRIWGIIALVLHVCAARGAWAKEASSDRNSSMEDRISSLEQRLHELEELNAAFYTQSTEGQGRVRAFFSDKVLFGGFFENGITYVTGPDTETQASANSNIFGLNIAAEITDRFKFNAQILNVLGYNFLNRNNNPRLVPDHREFSTVVFGTLVAHSYLEYMFSPALIMQTGIGYAPYGYAYQEREPVLFLRRNGPLMLSGAGVSNTGVAFPLWMGLHVHGSASLFEGHQGYNVYTFSPSSNPKTMGLGARLWWAPIDELTVGISGQSSKESDNDFRSQGFDLRYKRGRYGVTAEYGRSVVSTVDLATESYYVEPFMSFAGETIVAYLAADYIDNPEYNAQSGGTIVTDPYKVWGWGAGVNWLPSPHVRLRLGYLAYQYVGDTSSIDGQQRDYSTLDLSAGVTF